MTYDELIVEVVRMAVRYGMPKDMARADLKKAESWLAKYVHVAEEALLEQERGE